MTEVEKSLSFKEKFLNHWIINLLLLALICVVFLIGFLSINIFFKHHPSQKENTISTQNNSAIIVSDIKTKDLGTIPFGYDPTKLKAHVRKFYNEDNTCYYLTTDYTASIPTLTCVKTH